VAIYACTDLHGRLDLYHKIKTILNPEDRVFFLGDAGDRGLDGWELIKAIYNDPQFIYIKGNHEDMLVDAIKAYIRNPQCESREYKHLQRNGGKKTIEDWWQDGQDVSWVDKLDNLPLHAEYKNANGTLILMSHAGYTPWSDPEDPGKIIIPGEIELLWSRDHFYDNWNDECFQNCIVVHGHTTIIHLANYLRDQREEIEHGAYIYCDGHKICIDNLSAYSDVACLLNLDTLDPIIVQ
jgi:hypothetical protein